MSKKILKYADFSHIADFVKFQEDHDIEIQQVTPIHIPSRSVAGYLESAYIKVFVTYYEKS